jgi:hypothetical protein
MGNRGRPKKNYVELHTQVPEAVKRRLETMSLAFNLSCGEMIGLLIALHDQRTKQLVANLALEDGE